MLQNATLLRKSAPGPPNSSDEHVSCTAPATRNSSLQILIKCPTPAIVFGNATKPSRFAHFWQGAQSLAPATQNDNLNVQKCPVPPQIFALLTSKCASRHKGVLCTFWLANVLRATMACTFSTSQLPKVLRTWGTFYILTWQCASRHNGVHFFDISTSKSGPRMVCFVHLDFQMCFAPKKRRAIFHPPSGQMAPHRRFSEPLRSHKSLEKRSESPLSYLFPRLHLPSADSFSSLIFSPPFSSLTLTTSAFPSPTSFNNYSNIQRGPLNLLIVRRWERLGVLPHPMFEPLGHIFLGPPDSSPCDDDRFYLLLLLSPGGIELCKGYDTQVRCLASVLI